MIIAIKGITNHQHSEGVKCHPFGILMLEFHLEFYNNASLSGLKNQFFVF